MGRKRGRSSSRSRSPSSRKRRRSEKSSRRSHRDYEHSRDRDYERDRERRHSRRSRRSRRSRSYSRSRSRSADKRVKDNDGEMITTTGMVFNPIQAAHVAVSQLSSQDKMSSMRVSQLAQSAAAAANIVPFTPQNLMMPPRPANNLSIKALASAAASIAHNPNMSSLPTPSATPQARPANAAPVFIGGQPAVMPPPGTIPINIPAAAIAAASTPIAVMPPPPMLIQNPAALAPDIVGMPEPKIPAILKTTSAEAQKQQKERQDRLKQWKEVQRMKKLEEATNTKIEADRIRQLANAEAMRRQREVKSKHEYHNLMQRLDQDRSEIEKELADRIAKTKASRSQQAAERDQKDKEHFAKLLESAKENGHVEQKEDVEMKESAPQGEDVVDPLDAFMLNLDKKEAVVRKIVPRKKRTRRVGEVMYNDETVYEDDDIMIDEEPMWQKRVNKKEIVPLDHSEIEYERFEKNLYIEAPDICQMTAAEVARYRATELESCKVVGVNCPKPIKRWSQCGLPDKILRGLARNGYTQPFPIQSQALPAIMSGRDVIGTAKTGSGKTLAFLLPMYRHILQQRPLEAGEGPLGMILAPTRELALQICSEAKKFARMVDLTCCPVYGGIPMTEQINLVKRGAEIFVGTPGRMIDVLCTNQGRLVSLTRVTYFVIDEADRMFDMGFEPQLMSILGNVRPDRQLVMFSATFPKVIEKTAKKALDNPLHIIVGTLSAASENVTQYVEVVETKKDKFDKLLSLFGSWYGTGCILVFMKEREGCDEMFRKLHDCGYRAGILHGGVDQSDRDDTLARFKHEIVPVLIATSVGARGLDVDALNLVINYDAPDHYEDYVHRVGRTGRAGRMGTAYTFLLPDQFRPAYDVLRAMEKSKQQANITKELRAMVKTFKQKVAAGEEKLHQNKGFLTRGYKFSAEEGSKRDKDIARQKLQYGTADEIHVWGLDDKNEFSTVEEKQIEQIEQLKKEVEKISREEQGSGAQDQIQKQINTLKNSLTKARGLLSRGIKKDKLRAVVAQDIQRGKEKEMKKSQQKAKSMSALLSAQLSMTGVKTNDGFTMIFDINDFPEHARTRIMSHNNQRTLFQNYNVQLKMNGEYIHPNKQKGTTVATERLHIAITGDSEHHVKAAKRELKQIITELASKPPPRNGFGFNQKRYI